MQKAKSLVFFVFVVKWNEDANLRQKLKFKGLFKLTEKLFSVAMYSLNRKLDILIGKKTPHKELKHQLV